MDALKMGLEASANVAKACKNGLLGGKRFKFSSQICTSREQSERLLALGLKKETADMALVENWDWSEEDGKYFTGEYFERPIDYVEGLRDKWIPAWSLHRLIEMADTSYLVEKRRDDDNELWMCLDRCYCWNNHKSFYNINLYGSLIDCIEWLIKRGYFNNKYLCEK